MGSVWGSGAGIGGGDDANGGHIEVMGGRVEGHGWQAFGHGKGASDSGTLWLGENIWAGECDNIFPYSQRYDKARIPEVYLIER